jgi:hypothetical protein
MCGAADERGDELGGARSGIDVERLARAMSRVGSRNHARRMYNGPKAAAAIAREYELISEPKP